MYFAICTNIELCCTTETNVNYISIKKKKKIRKLRFQLWNGKWTTNKSEEKSNKNEHKIYWNRNNKLDQNYNKKVIW